MPEWMTTPGSRSTALGAISTLQAGRAVRAHPGESKRWNYTHLLSDAQRAAGFKLTVQMAAGDPSRLLASVWLKGAPYDARYVKDQVGTVGGQMSVGRHDAPTLRVNTSNLMESFRGQGLARAAYEALLRQAWANGARYVASDGPHSTLAKRVHESLARRHGVDYRAVPNDEAHDGDWPQREWNEMERHPEKWSLDARWKPYEYALNESP